MTDAKTLLASRTVWANLVGLAALAAPFLGLDPAALDAERLPEALATLVAAGGFVASTLFRVVATKRIARRAG